MRRIASGVSLLFCIIQHTTVLIFSTIWLVLRSALAVLLRRDEALVSNESCTYYRGNVVHVRQKPVKHQFKYDVRYVVLDLENPPLWFNRQSDHLTADAARRVAGTDGQVRLLTLPASAGYHQNPISVYYCFNKPLHISAPAELGNCIAEVTNTPWGERVTFPFTPSGYTVPKSLHVSPMMDMKGLWRLRTSPPTDTFSLSVAVNHPDHGDFFTAVLNLKRCDRISGSLERWVWMRPHWVGIWIYWHALVLLYKGVSF
eukprot:CAMPEP_0198215568 /NCGR_PEP_ID=MMETSP1445-20131203/50894_1 /TAXON_ID=36898 /ORGANISM="Pyramimonas sp., Strain CCMP2087" /LENGTH=257 /DNA_ID=CAMNT_0043891361 /DNA_START=124 /DNA_END=894 /DNA_ORIENTATION=+